jgi:carbonic anhydrase/acetyltransferase-like protein (isoleucine patch superfamily)
MLEDRSISKESSPKRALFKITKAAFLKKLCSHRKVIVSAPPGMTQLAERVFIHASAQVIGNVRIGADSSVTGGHAAILHGCRIGNECLVGMGSIVMDDVVVEDGTMIGAGSLVPPGKTLQGGFLYMGRPAEQVRPLTEAEIAWLRFSAEHYVRVKDNYLQAPP